VRRTGIARAGALAGAGALAAVAASLACRRPEPTTADCLRLDGPQAPVGFDATFSITATLACPDLRGGRIAWEQLSGPPVVGLSPTRDGFELGARTPSLADVMGGPIPWGVVPLSPRTRGEIVLRATWSDGRGHTFARDARVAAAHRSRGLPNSPVGVRVHLGGQGWHVTARPANSNAALARAGGVASLLPDVAGDWRLADGGGRTLALRTARYDETPLDCGRSGCHAAITDAAAASPMTSVLARLLDASARPSDYPACAVACHATGEPGAADGGFAHVAGELGAAGDLGRRWRDLPRDLHRLGGVGCLACHGPGAIPESTARWSVLRADVCAVCHDAPPRYGHVLAWRLTAMARADQNPRARGERACARCHTTWGFLDAVATPERQPVDRRPPDDVGPVGIGCAACHAVHDGKRPGARRLLRATPTPALLTGAGATGESVCLPCHTPDAGDERPRASAAALWLGRGGLDPSTGAALTGAAPHAGIPGGCVGCHRAGPDDVERGAGHGFRAPASVCAPCHPQPVPSSQDVRARAQQLWQALRKTDAGGPAHAAERDGLRVDKRKPLGRATWDLLLVLEDPAAGAHNARYAQALLDAAASVIEAGDTGRAR
jgi:hypothetical protein